MKKAIFIDRDGTLIVDKDYLANPDEIELLPKSLEGLKILQELGYLLFIITNQSGVARGYFTEDDVVRVHLRLKELLHEHEIEIAGIYYCPHYIDGEVPEFSIDCNCRKPKPGMLFQARDEFDITLTKSIVIGDKRSDVLLGHHIGGKGILVLTGHGKQQRDLLEDVSPDYIGQNLYEAAIWIKEFID